jgi:DNA (cytosine-5)-methyltransferase 1
MSALTCLDLFCGCGGFSLGMQRAGFRVLAAIDFNEEAVATFKANFSTDTLALCEDLTEFPPDKLAVKLGVSHVDVIVGGPPCQGFSTVRQRDAANHGSRVKRDKRRYLYRVFFDYVAAFSPRVFVMENVMGIQSAAKGKFFTLVQSDARKLGYRVHTQVEEAWRLGVPQKRRRQLIIGVLNNVPGYFPSELKPVKRAPKNPTLWDAIGDLPPLAAGKGLEECDYNFSRRKTFLAKRGKAAKHYLKKVLEIADATKLTAHRARPHSKRDLRDFARLREGETGDHAIARGEKMEFPYDRSVFFDRYTRQHRERLCSTIVAHLSKDGLMFIHPTQKRSLTPREAARVQTFPDWFQFPGTRTHQFRIIGNAVPPLVAEAVGCEVKEFLNPVGTVQRHKLNSKRKLGKRREHRVSQSAMEKSRLGARKVKSRGNAAIQKDRVIAALELQQLAGLDRRALRSLPTEQFLHGWRALLFLFPNLHPDNALDHGHGDEEISPDQLALPGYKELLEKRYIRSGWPVALDLVGQEAWRRFETGGLKKCDLYYSEVQEAGMAFQNKTRQKCKIASLSSNS